MATYKVTVSFSDRDTGRWLAEIKAEVSGTLSPAEAAHRVAMDTINSRAILRGRNIHWEWTAEEEP
jgi:hypothetical protein